MQMVSGLNSHTESAYDIRARLGLKFDLEKTLVDVLLVIFYVISSVMEITRKRGYLPASGKAVRQKRVQIAYGLAG